VKTQRERDEEKRQAQLELMQQQIDAGTLVVRKMTPKERAKYQPRAKAPRKRGAA
jgi:hypothetical protein